MSDTLEVVHTAITEDMNRALTRSVTDDEINAATFKLGASIAPGPDGFFGIFYHKHCKVVGHDVYAAIKSFFTGGFVLRELNHTNLVLIFKVAAPAKLTQYRPISLCNFSMKIITKVLANRLKGVLCNLITLNQSAFVSRQLIQDNILVAHEAFHFLKHK